MFNRLDAIEEKYNELTKDLANPEILNDFNKVKELSKEQSDLEETVKTYQSYKQAKNNLEEAKIMENDPELREIALEEIDNLTKEIDKLYHELEVLLVPKDENDGKNVIIEIRGAAGGDEEIYLPETYLECILIMPRPMDGKLKSFMLLKVPAEDILK